jgi:hypothetical protein
LLPRSRLLLRALRLRLLPGLLLLILLSRSLRALLLLRRRLLPMLRRVPDFVGLLRLLGTRLRFLRPGLLTLVRLGLLRLRPFLLGLRGTLLWSWRLSALLRSRLLSTLLLSWLLSPLLRLLRVLLRLFLLLPFTAFVLPVNGQQHP